MVFASTGTAKITGSAERAAIETSITRLRSGPQVASVSDPLVLYSAKKTTGQEGRRCAIKQILGATAACAPTSMWS